MGTNKYIVTIIGGAVMAHAFLTVFPKDHTFEAEHLPESRVSYIHISEPLFAISGSATALPVLGTLTLDRDGLVYLQI